MPQTFLRTQQIADGTIRREDLDVSTVGSSVVRRLIAGTGISFASTGADTGTGDVTINQLVAGSSGQVISNQAGVYAGDAGMTYDTSTDALTLGAASATSGLVLAAVPVGTASTAPAAGFVRLIARNYAGFMQLALVNELGAEYQIARDNTTQFTASDVGIASAPTVIGTQSTSVVAATNKKTSTLRQQFLSAATAGAFASQRTGLEFWRGNAAGLGGFYICKRTSLDTLQTGMRAFFGIVEGNAAPTNVDPLASTALSKVGLAINLSTGNWSFINNLAGTAPTVLALGAGFPVNTTDEHELLLYCPPNGSAINYQITNLTTNAAPTTGVLTTNIPPSATFMTRMDWVTNNATAAAVQYSITRNARRGNF